MIREVFLIAKWTVRKRRRLTRYEREIAKNDPVFWLDVARTERR